MSALLRKNMKPSPTTAGTYNAISGSAPQTVNGNPIAVMNPDGSSGLCVAPGTLSAKVVIRLTTNTITVSGKWQVSEDGSTWINAAQTPNNAAAVVLATGTGSLATTTLAVPAPDVVYGYSKTRFVLTSGVASGGGAGQDEASISYNCRVMNAVL